VTGRRRRLLDACLASLQAQRDAPSFELLVCAEGDPDVAETVWARFSDARVVSVEKALPGAARNLLIPEARGELLLFLDDDIVVQPCTLRTLADLAASRPDTVVFGGPNLTPPGASRYQEVQGAALSSLVATGPVRRRWGAHPAGPADERYFTLCNLAVRRDAMLPFATDLVCAEENAVLRQMSRQRVPMHYDPGLVVYHERRPTPSDFARQIYKYGRGRGQVLARESTSARPSYLAAPLLLAYLALLPLAAWLQPLALVPLVLYMLGVLAGAAKIAATLRSSRCLPSAIAAIVMIHVCYGAGIYAGFVAPRRRRAAPQGNWLEPTAERAPSR
jgi:glycosyltransferase involved in cell wall biosynthesis